MIVAESIPEKSGEIDLDRIQSECENLAEENSVRKPSSENNPFLNYRPSNLANGIVGNSNLGVLGEINGSNFGDAKSKFFGFENLEPSLVKGDASFDAGSRDLSFVGNDNGTAGNNYGSKSFAAKLFQKKGIELPVGGERKSGNGGGLLGVKSRGEGGRLSAGLGSGSGLANNLFSRKSLKPEGRKEGILSYLKKN